MNVCARAHASVIGGRDGCVMVMEEVDREICFAVFAEFSF